VTAPGPYAALWRLSRAGTPVALVLYRDPSSREDWIEVLRELLAGPDHEAKVTAEVSEVLGNVDLPIILAVDPEQEAECIGRLSVARDRLLERRRPVVLLLQQDGPGLRRLRQEAALASFVQGSPEVDVDEEVDVESERTDFQKVAGFPPEEWLSRYRSGDIDDTLDSALLYLRALFLERESS